MALGGRAEVELEPGTLEHRTIDDVARDQIHRGCTEELTDKPVGGLCIDIHRRTDLLDHASVEDDNPRCERHRLDLIVGHIDDRRTELLVELGDLCPHLGSKRRVEIRQWLVEQEHLGPSYDRSPHRDTLSLAAGQLLGFAVEQLLEAEHCGGFVGSRLYLGRGGLAHAQAESQVVGNGQVGVERVALKDHRDVAVFWRELGDVGVSDRKHAVGWLFEAGDDSKGC